MSKLGAKQIQKYTNKAIARENAKYGAVFVRIPEEAWPRTEPVSEKLKELWRNREFVVQVYAEKDGIFRLSVCKTAVTIQGRWVDGISWDELQAIKNAVGFGEYDAVEIYPKDDDVVNVANMRHLWIMNGELPFVWRKV